MGNLEGISIIESLEINILRSSGFSQTLLPLPLDKSHYLLLFLLVVLLLVKMIKDQFRSCTNDKIPWLPSLPVIGSLHHVFWNRNDLAKLQEKWLKQYPAIAQTKCFGKKVVVINSPTLLLKLLSSSDQAHVNKPEIIYSVLFLGPSKKGLVASKSKVWEPHRKLLNKAFNYEMLKSYVAVFNKHANKLINSLDTSSEISVDHEVSNCCLEVISEIIFGLSIQEALTQSEYLAVHGCLNRFKQIITNRLDKPLLLWDFLWKLHPKSREEEANLDKLLSYLDKIMHHCKDLILSRNNDLEYEAKSVLEVMISENWSNEEILSESGTFLVGGHETMGVALNFLFFLLAAHKEHQIACQSEVDQLFHKLENSNEEISIQSLSELKYLERCIKETLRMFPTVPMPFRDITAPLRLDDEITLDAGTIVGFSIWGLHRNPEYYPNPEKYDPNRFLTENCKKRVPNSYIPFSGGTRNCIGWKMAMLEMTTITAKILRNFDIFTTDKLEDIKIKFSITIWPEKELNVSLKRRSVRKSISNQQ